MIVEYWLADLFGRAQRGLYGRRRADFERKAAACREIGKGGRPADRELVDAQGFAASMWIRAAMACALLFFVVALVAGALPKGTARNLLADVVLAVAIACGAAMVQVIFLIWRRNWTFWSANRRAAGLAVNLREERRGLPRARDFWLVLAITAAGWAFIFYGSSHWNH